MLSLVSVAAAVEFPRLNWLVGLGWVGLVVWGFSPRFPFLAGMADLARSLAVTDYMLLSDADFRFITGGMLHGRLSVRCSTCCHGADAPHKRLPVALFSLFFRPLLAGGVPHLRSAHHQHKFGEL